MCKVSVIIPVYNKAQYLDNCLNSIESQSLREIEIICIDDGSTDESRDILERHARNDERIIVIAQQNQGASSARNRGIERARGRYIAFMDADDFYPDCDVLADLYHAATTHHSPVCGGSLYELSADGIQTNPKQKAKRAYLFEENGFVEFSDYQFDYGFTRFIFEKQLIQSRGIRFGSLSVYEDPLFLVEIMTVVKRFYALKRPSYIYRVEYHSRQWTSDNARDLAIALSREAELAIASGLSVLREEHLRRLHYSYLPALFSIKSELRDDALEALSALQESIPNSDESKLAASVHRGLRILVETAEVYRSMPRFYDLAPYSKTDNPSQKTTVSIVIPFFNSEEYLEHCIASALGQTYRNLDVVLVDDGSTDRSLSIAQKICGLDPRAQIVRKENGGLSSARNAGLLAATGDYVLFLDSDDLLVPSAVEHLLGVARDSNADQVFFSAQSFYDSYEALEQHPGFTTYYNYTGEYEKQLSGKELFVQLRENGDFKPSACLQLIKRDFLTEHSLTFMTGIIHEDNLFTVQCLSVSTSSFVLPEQLYLRRVRCESIMTSKKGLRNAFGYYRSIIGVARFLDAEPSSTERDFAEALQTQVSIWRRDAAKYTALASTEDLDAFLETLSVGDRVLFKTIIVDQVKSDRAFAKEKKKQSAEISRVKKSHSYRIGHMLLAPPRWLKAKLK